MLIAMKREEERIGQEDWLRTCLVGAGVLVYGHWIHDTCIHG